jgi:hypothetical protein
LVVSRVRRATRHIDIIPYVERQLMEYSRPVRARREREIPPAFVTTRRPRANPKRRGDFAEAPLYRSRMVSLAQR